MKSCGLSEDHNPGTAAHFRDKIIYKTAAAPLNFPRDSLQIQGFVVIFHCSENLQGLVHLLRVDGSPGIVVLRLVDSDLSWVIFKLDITLVLFSQVSPLSA